MKFCPIVPEICRGQVHVSTERKEKKEKNNNNNNNNNNNKKRSKNNKSPKLCLGDLINNDILALLVQGSVIQQQKVSTSRLTASQGNINTTASS